MLPLTLSLSIAEHMCSLLLSCAEENAYPSQLQHRLLSLYVTPIPVAVTFCFAEKLLILQETRTFAQTLATAGDEHCVVQVSIESLPLLKNSQHLSRLIREERLQLGGDIRIVQAMLTWLDGLVIDWEEQLAKKVGDVPAHMLFRFFRHCQQSVNWLSQVGQQQSANFLREEQQLLVTRPVYTVWKDDVQQLENALVTFEKRLAQYEK